MISTNECPHKKRVEELWRQFFSDTSQWWDHTKEKVNPKYPDFKHKTKSGAALWLNGKWNPSWVKTELASMVPGSVSRSLYSWNTTLSGYVNSGRGRDAVDLYDQMRAEGVTPDAFTFVRVLNAIASLASLEEGRRVHDHVIQSGWESDVHVGSTLVDMYGKCKSIGDAHRVFHGMPARDVVSWNAMLAGYVKCEEVPKALQLFRCMQSESVKPNAVTFVTVLNACARIMALEEGRRIHLQVIQCGLESDVVVGNSLVDLYGKCGSLEDAQGVFRRMPTRNVVSWSAMLSGYVKCNEGQKALELYAMMQEVVKPDPVTFVVVLKACASIMALEDGRRVHSQIIESGCESNLYVGNTLVDMYGKCGSAEDAWLVFHKMPIRDAVSWNAMLAGYSKCDEGQKALELFRQMQVEGVKPNPITFVVVLNACASIMALEEGRVVHSHVIRRGCESNIFIGNTLVDMYGKCGSIEDACRIFHRMPTRDVISWNAMLAGYVRCEQGQRALDFFTHMQAEGIKPNSITFVTVLNACSSIMALKEGKGVHQHIIRSGWESDVIVCNSLLEMYAKCGSIEDALRVFHRMPTRDVVSWSIMLAAYVKCEKVEKSLELFQQMQAEGVKPNSGTFVIVLNGCASIEALEKGRHVHAQVIENGWESDVFVGSTLVDMYAKCGSIEDAQRVFHRMPTRNVVSWSAMLTGYVKCEEEENALQLFQGMQAEGVKPNPVTFVAVLNACAKLMALEEGRLLHEQIIESGCESDVFVGSTLVDMYAKCGSIEDAQKVFSRMATRDVVSWNAMLTGCIKCEKEQKALKLFRQMQAEGVKANSVTFVVVLNACASTMALEEGRRVHAQVIKSGLESDVFVGSTLVDMYAKCGSIEDARRVFNRMPTRNVVTWSAMLGGFAMHGCGNEALQLFQNMNQAGVEMNMVTFVCLLSACSHAGMVDEGIGFFESMCSVYGISQTVEHYVCMVDLLGRAGRLDEAEDMLRNQPQISGDSIALMTLLGACRNYCNVEMGERIAQQVLDLDPDNVAAYVLLSNIYAAAGQWDCRDRVQEMCKQRV